MKENERKIEKDLSMILIWYVVRLFVLLFILFLRLIDFSLFMDIHSKYGSSLTRGIKSYPAMKDLPCNCTGIL